jgi:hypothetical protein
MTAQRPLLPTVVLQAFTCVMVNQLDSLSLWLNHILLAGYVATVGLQILVFYTRLRDLFGGVTVDWRVWIVMLIVVVDSSLTGIYMTCGIVKLL